MHMTLDSTPWTGERSVAGITTPRQLDCVDIGYWAYLLANPVASTREKYPNWWIDASQNADRRPWGATLPCLNKDSIPYSYKCERVLTVEDRR